MDAMTTTAAAIAAEIRNADADTIREVTQAARIAAARRNARSGNKIDADEVGSELIDRLLAHTASPTADDSQSRTRFIDAAANAAAIAVYRFNYSHAAAPEAVENRDGTPREIADPRQTADDVATGEDLTAKTLQAVERVAGPIACDLLAAIIRGDTIATAAAALGLNYSTAAATVARAKKAAAEYVRQYA